MAGLPIGITASGRGLALKNGLTAAGAVTSAEQLKIDFPDSPSGLYWLEFADGSKHQVLFDMTTSGGGWMNVNTAFGPYSTALTTTWGTGGGNFLSGISGTSDTQITTASVYNNQAATYGCGTPTAAESSIYLNQNIFNEKSITEIRIKGTLVNKYTGYIDCAGVSRGDFTAVSLISGNQKAWGECSGTGFGAQTSIGDTFDVILSGFATPAATNVRFVGGHTACYGPAWVTFRIDGIWIR